MRATGFHSFKLALQSFGGLQYIYNATDAKMLSYI